MMSLPSLWRWTTARPAGSASTSTNSYWTRCSPRNVLARLQSEHHVVPYITIVMPTSLAAGRRVTRLVPQPAGVPRSPGAGDLEGRDGRGDRLGVLRAVGVGELAAGGADGGGAGPLRRRRHLDRGVQGLVRSERAVLGLPGHRGERGAGLLVVAVVALLVDGAGLVGAAGEGGTRRQDREGHHGPARSHGLPFRAGGRSASGLQQ